MGEAAGSIPAPGSTPISSPVMGKAKRRKHGIVSLEHFTQTAAHELVNLEVERFEGVLVFGHTTVVKLMGIEHADDDGTVASKSDQLFASRPRYVGLASPTRWSPDQVTPFQEGWMLVTVDQSAAPAQLTIIWQPGPNVSFHRIDMFDAPWIAASTAGSLRAALAGEPPTFRRGPTAATDPRLFGKVRDAFFFGAEPPPTHQDGKI